MNQYTQIKTSLDSIIKEASTNNELTEGTTLVKVPVRMNQTYEVVLSECEYEAPSITETKKLLNDQNEPVVVEMIVAEEDAEKITKNEYNYFDTLYFGSCNMMIPGLTSPSQVSFRIEANNIEEAFDNFNEFSREAFVNYVKEVKERVEEQEKRELEQALSLGGNSDNLIIPG